MSCTQSITAPAFALDTGRELVRSIYDSCLAEFAMRPVREVLLETLGAMNWAVMLAGAAPVPEASAVIALLSFYSPRVCSPKHAERIAEFRHAVTQTLHNHAYVNTAYRKPALECRDRWLRITARRAEQLLGTSYYPIAQRRLRVLIAKVQAS